MKCSLGISNFLEEISRLSHSIVFLYFFALIAEEGFLISLCFSLDVLYFELTDGASFVARPSGTEPKIKLYYLIQSETEESAKNVLAEVKTAVEAYMNK